MPKNDWLSQQQAKIEVMLQKTREIAIQQMIDWSVIAYSEVYEEETGNELAKEQGMNFLYKLNEVMTDFSQMTLDDAKPNRKGGNGDKHLNYTKGKLDQRLQAIFGEDLIPFEERYHDEN